MITQSEGRRVDSRHGGFRDFDAGRIELFFEAQVARIETTEPEIGQVVFLVLGVTSIADGVGGRHCWCFWLRVFVVKVSLKFRLWFWLIAGVDLLVLVFER